MVYRVIGLMSGSSLDGLDIAFVELQENSGKWTYNLQASECIPYTDDWVDRLRNTHKLPAFEYQLLHTEFGHFCGNAVNGFIKRNNLDYKVQLIVSHGHTTFHVPDRKMTGQIGDGAAIAAVTGINVVSDLRAMDVALGGQGAPIVPIGEKLLFGDFDFFLNIGGIANLSYSGNDQYIAFDVCPSNRVLNLLVKEEGHAFDENGAIARTGSLNETTLKILNNLEYYSNPYPKSLANSFGTDIIFPLIEATGKTPDLLHTYVEHIAYQISRSISQLITDFALPPAARKILVTGGGAHNGYLMERLEAYLSELNVSISIPDASLIEFKEAIIMGLIGVLRWREENNVLSSVTGASRNSIGGAVWIGQEA